MPRTGAKLINCYVPLPLSSRTSNLSKDKSKQKLVIPTERDSGDGKTTRNAHSLRRLVLESNVVQSAAGSALVELGHTKVIAQVLGPLTSTSEHVPSFLELNMEEGTLHCEVKYAAHTGFPTANLIASSVSTVDNSSSQFSSGKINSWTITRETDLSSHISSALAAAVPLKQYPKCALILKLTVLQDDGCVLTACITAASLALADAGIEIFDLVTCGSVAVVPAASGDGDSTVSSGGQAQILLADPDLAEITASDALMTIAVLPNWKEVALWEQSGRLTAAQANQAMELCRDACRTMHRFMREHLIEQQQQNSSSSSNETQ